MSDENLMLLKEILSLPSYTGKEDRVVDFLISYGVRKGYKVFVDHVNNVYFTKGSVSEYEYFPCFVAHTDTVHMNQSDLIKEDRRKIINHHIDEYEQNILYATHPDSGEQIGIGGDDLAGVYLALRMMDNYEDAKGAFFVSEENGCNGSKHADDAFFSNVGYAIQFDSPTDNRISHTLMGVRLYSKEFQLIAEDILRDYYDGQWKYMHDPYTDVLELKKQFDFCCYNLPAGYYNYHTNSEYVILETIETSEEIACRLVDALGTDHYYYEEVSDYNTEVHQNLLLG